MQCWAHAQPPAVCASMGPRSEKRGYEDGRALAGGEPERAQWVHGPRTVVMESMAEMGEQVWETLQWVHGPRTVVMRMEACKPHPAKGASMGPRSENRGYALSDAANGLHWLRLQWVHGPRTV